MPSSALFLLVSAPLSAAPFSSLALISAQFFSF